MTPTVIRELTQDQLEPLRLPYRDRCVKPLCYLHDAPHYWPTQEGAETHGLAHLTNARREGLTGHRVLIEHSPDGTWEEA